MGKVTSRDGTTISFMRSGSGSPLVLVHGTSADHRRWVTVSARFEPEFTLYAVDRRGRSGSGDGPEYSLLREAEDVAAVIDAVSQTSGTPVDLLGHSYGAICCLEASQLTENIGRLVLYEPPITTGAPITPPEIIARIQALVNQGELEAGLEVFFRDTVKMPEYELEQYRQLPMWQRRIQLAPTLAREMQAVNQYRFDPGRFAGLQTPVLLLLGSDSPPFFGQAIESLALALPNAQATVLQGQQHIAMDLAPELFHREVRRFLAQPE